MSFNFRAQLEVGDRGEEFMLRNYRLQAGEKLEPMPKKSPIGDFRIVPSGKIIELKTDTYPLERTPNFFMEYHSNQEKKTIGGPWRAFEHGADLFVYLFIASSTYFKFENPQQLVSRLSELIKRDKLKPVRILNTSWITTGYKVPREVLKDLYEEVKIEAKVLSQIADK